MTLFMAWAREIFNAKGLLVLLDWRSQSRNIFGLQREKIKHLCATLLTIEVPVTGEGQKI